MTRTTVSSIHDHRFALTSWSTEGTAVLDVTAESVQHMLALAMNGLIAALHPARSSHEASGKSLRIRGEGADTLSLLCSLANELIEELDSLHVSPVDFVVEGMVRSESGLIAWGLVAISNDSDHPLQRVQLVEVTAISVRSDRHTARLLLQHS